MKNIKEDGYLNCFNSKIKVNKTLAKIFQNGDPLKSYTNITNVKKKFQKNSSFQNIRQKMPSFIQKPAKPNSYLLTSDSPKDLKTNNSFTRVQTEPQILNSNNSYLNSIVKQRIATVCDSRPDSIYFYEEVKKKMERNKRKSLSNGSSENLKNQNKSVSFHKRNKTLLNISNESMNFPNNSSNFTKMPKIKEEYIKSQNYQLCAETVLKEFLNKNLKESKLSVLGYLEKFFELLDTLKENDFTFKLIKDIVILPFKRISEQFENIKGLYKEKIIKVEFLLKEKEKSDALIQNILKENDDLKNKIKQCEEIIINTKKERDILIKELPKIRGKSFSNIENRTPNTSVNFDLDKPKEKNDPKKKEFNEEMKKKLHLNLDIVKKKMLDEEIRVEMCKINGVPSQKNIIDFHDEFMSKFEEFSVSWKNQALQEKKYF